MPDPKELESELRKLRVRYGYGTFDYIIKKLARERLQVNADDRPRRKYRWSEYMRMYQEQKGKCPLCTEPLLALRGWLAMDHINPNLTNPEFDARSNRQVVHPDCNSRKAARSLLAQSKRSAKTIRQLQAGGMDEIEDL
jgi:5-methylcytosine-specific restriction endonuclease McrA